MNKNRKLKENKIKGQIEETIVEETEIVGGGNVTEVTEITETTAEAVDITAAEAEAERNALAESIDEGDYLLKVEHLKKYFPLATDFFGKPTSFVRAVDDVTFGVKAGQTVGIVGESGCGKTTMGRTVLRLHSVTGGKVIFDGHDIGSMSASQLRKIRPQIQMIFQDPYSSLSPRLRVGDIIGEAVAEHGIVPKEQLKDYVLSIMNKCGLQTHYYERYPHEFSGGQRQRICIARALALKPKLVICDEPVSALDVSIQAQIINLLKSLQKNDGIAYIFISHDLSVVEHISDEVGVMYLGSMSSTATKRIYSQIPCILIRRLCFRRFPFRIRTLKTRELFLKAIYRRPQIRRRVVNSIPAATNAWKYARPKPRYSKNTLRGTGLLATYTNKTIYRE